MPAFQAGDARFKPGRGRHFFPSALPNRSRCKIPCSGALAGILCGARLSGFQVLQGSRLEHQEYCVRKIIGTGRKLLLVCLLIGWVLSVIVIDALGIIRFLSQSLRHAGELATDGVRWAVPYILLGAVMVVPFYIVKLGLDLLKRRRK
jgi:hypothetical protein